MNRRDTLLALLAFGTGLHSTTHAQAQVRRIGFLSPDGANHPNGERTRAAFPAALKRLGYEEGRNLAIEWRWAQAKWDSLPALAADLVRLKVELIVARINQPIEAAMRATQTIPIVMFNANYPVELGLVQSLARPGGNVTGTSFRSPQVLEKLLQLLREIAPKAIRIALPWEGAATRMNGAGKISVQAYERAAARLGMKIQYFDAVRGEEVEGLIERIAASPVEALVLHGAAVFRPYFAQLIAAANARGIAVVGAVDTIASAAGCWTTRRTT